MLVKCHRLLYDTIVVTVLRRRENNAKPVSSQTAKAKAYINDKHDLSTLFSDKTLVILGYDELSKG